jgi:hypothetical protein
MGHDILPGGKGEGGGHRKKQKGKSSAEGVPNVLLPP